MSRGLRGMRILIVSHPALSLESGAAQVAMNLAAALRDRGHEATAWSPEPLPRTRFWDRWLQQRRLLEEHLQSRRFDVIDAPAVSISPRVAKAAPLVVARSVQPELLYQRVERRERRLVPRSPLRKTAEEAVGRAVSRAVVAGWRRAGVVLCLGSLEARWMRERFPWTAPKLAVYALAPASADQEALAAVRAARRPWAGGTRFLWVGRWVPQKGTRFLVQFLTHWSTFHRNDTFTLAGCGDEALRDCPKGLVFSGRVQAVPSFSRRDLPKLLAEHDAGLFTSEVEGWGLSLNEMLEAGLPVYATEAGGVEDLKPFFPLDLRPFPPPFGPVSPAGDDPAATGYYERFTWARIAERYEADVLSRKD